MPPGRSTLQGGRSLCQPSRVRDPVPDDRSHARGGQHPSYPIHDHDRDRVHGADFATRIAGLGIESLRTQSPRANAIGERVVRTLREECLDHILPREKSTAGSIAEMGVDGAPARRRPRRTDAQPVNG